MRGQHSLGLFKKDVKPWPWVDLQSRYFETLFAKLRLGKVALNKYLFRINKTESPECPTCQCAETVHHYFMVCSEYSLQREELTQELKSLGFKSLRLEVLLAGLGCNLREVTAVFRSVEKFIENTGRFSNV